MRANVAVALRPTALEGLECVTKSVLFFYSCNQHCNGMSVFNCFNISINSCVFQIVSFERLQLYSFLFLAVYLPVTYSLNKELSCALSAAVEIKTLGSCLNSLHVRHHFCTHSFSPNLITFRAPSLPHGTCWGETPASDDSSHQTKLI